MTREFDEEVRDSMTWFTDGVDVPAGITASARRHLRRQRRARLGWLAGGTAVAAAVAVLIGTLGSSAAPPHQIATSPTPGVTAQTTAMVVSQIEHALTKATTSNPVAYTSQTTRGVKLFVAPPHGRPAEVNSTVTRTWSRGPLEHVEFATSAGRLELGMEIDQTSGKSVQTTISYPRRVWWRGTYQVPPATKPEVACTLGETTRTPAQWTREVRKLLSCGAVVAGHSRVDGVRTIKLKLSSTVTRACAGSNSPGKCQPVSVGWTGMLWADAATYLPVRLLSRGQHFGFLIDFGWLAPTAANLAKLHQPIPAGYRHV
jgi:hypothetical protein